MMPAAHGRAVNTGIGAPVRRLEDARLITGHGHYVDDMQLPGTVYAYVLRSPHAHARIVRVDKRAALAMPGVHLVLTGEDVVRDAILRFALQRLSNVSEQSRSHRPVHPILATDKVRHVGDRVALVVADTLAQAKDAAEEVLVEYEELPPWCLQRRWLPMPQRYGTRLTTTRL